MMKEKKNAGYEKKNSLINPAFLISIFYLTENL